MRSRKRRCAHQPILPPPSLPAPCPLPINRGCAICMPPPHGAPILCTKQIQIITETQAVAQAITSQANQEASMIPIEITPPIPLQRKFEELVMCNYTPRKPSTLPLWRWVGCANTATRAARGPSPPSHLCRSTDPCSPLSALQTGGCTSSFTRSLRRRCGSWGRAT